MNEKQILHDWLDRVCHMIQGIRNAVYLEQCGNDGEVIYWLDEAESDEKLRDSALRACKEGRLLVERLDNSDSSQAVSDHIISKPLKGANSDNAAVSIIVNMDPAQQGVVIQLLNWGESWLQLINDSAASPDRANTPAMTNAPHSASINSTRFTLPSAKILGLILLLLVVAAMGVFPGTYRVSAPAFLEGSVQRSIVAPFEGYIATGLKKAGDTVAGDDVLAEMDAASLRLSQQQFESEKDEYNRQYRQALGRRDMAEAYIHKSQLQQADAQLSMIRRKIEQSQVRSPISGVLISGDLSRSQGAPVKLGEVLFEVAPLDDYRLVIQVDERDVAAIQPGARGLVSLRAMPRQEFPFSVFRISPVFEEKLDSVAYRVEASLDETHQQLRPGMQGTVKIEAGQRRYLWIYFHEIFDALSLWLWKWMP